MSYCYGHRLGMDLKAFYFIFFRLAINCCQLVQIRNSKLETGSFDHICIVVDSLHVTVTFCWLSSQSWRRSVSNVSWKLPNVLRILTKAFSWMFWSNFRVAETDLTALDCVLYNSNMFDIVFSSTAGSGTVETQSSPVRNSDLFWTIALLKKIKNASIFLLTNHGSHYSLLGILSDQILSFFHYFRNFIEGLYIRIRISLVVWMVKTLLC